MWKNEMSKVRESNYDLLRIISIIMVISIHVKWIIYFCNNIKNMLKGEVNNDHHPNPLPHVLFRRRN